MNPALRTALPYALTVVAFAMGWVVSPQLHERGGNRANSAGGTSAEASMTGGGSDDRKKDDASPELRKGRLLSGLLDAVN
jgi:hypothetical protein